jgi:carboxyl-terminal processing protease
MFRNNLYHSLLLICFLMSLLFVSCEKEEAVSDEQAAKIAVKDIMNSWYFWNDKIPEVNINDYQNVYKLLDAMRYTEKDVWSFIQPWDKFIQLFEQGEYEGYGFGFKPDAAGNLFITFVFKDSPLYEKGVGRGWQIIGLDGQVVNDIEQASDLLAQASQNDFSFIMPSGDTVDYTFQKKIIKQNTVLHHEIIDTLNTSIGYMVLQSFITPTYKEVDNVFQQFSDEEIDELILDLRYNGGGDASAASYLASSIIKKEKEGELFIRYLYNDNKQSKNVDINFEGTNYSLGLNRLVVITMEGTASASEMIVKGLEPYIDVKLVGQQTYGKPVGMNVFDLQDYGYAFAPVTFKIVNKNDNGDYYDGIPVDATVNDNIKRKFGDRQEDCLQESIYYLLNGSFSGKSYKNMPAGYEIPYKGFKLILQAE